MGQGGIASREIIEDDKVRANFHCQPNSFTLTGSKLLGKKEVNARKANLEPIWTRSQRSFHFGSYSYRHDNMFKKSIGQPKRVSLVE